MSFRIVAIDKTSEGNCQKSMGYSSFSDLCDTWWKHTSRAGILNQASQSNLRVSTIPMAVDTFKEDFLTVCPNFLILFDGKIALGLCPSNSIPTYNWTKYTPKEQWCPNCLVTLPLKFHPYIQVNQIHSERTVVSVQLFLDTAVWASCPWVGVYSYPVSILSSEWTLVEL